MSPACAAAAGLLHARRSCAASIYHNIIIFFHFFCITPSAITQHSGNNPLLEIESTFHQRDTEMRGVYKLGTYVPKIAASCWVAPTAAVVGNVIMLEQSSVWFGATVRGDNPEPITIGER